MDPHNNSEDWVERFLIGGLRGRDLEAFEEHLLLCALCQGKVHELEFIVKAFAGAAKRLRLQNKSTRGSQSKGYYVLMQRYFQNLEIENVGILLVDIEPDALHSLFRRDLDELNCGSTPLGEFLLKIEAQAKNLGAQRCLRWIELMLVNGLYLTGSIEILIEDHAATVKHLYQEHVRSKVLPFRTHLPQYSLEAAAGKFGKQMEIEPEGWVEVFTENTLTEDMFVTHVKGHSMEPDITDQSLCAFRSKIVGPWNGKVLLLEHYGEAGGNRYTIKRFHVSDHADPNHEGDGKWLHERMTLESTNPAYQPWDVPSADKTRAIGEFVFAL